MEALTTWFKKSSPVVKLLALISATSGIVVVHRIWYGPYIKRQRYRRAEEWANMILEQEEKAKETGETYTNNISY